MITTYHYLYFYNSSSSKLSTMGIAANIAGGAALQIVVASLLVTVSIYACLWAPAAPRIFFRLRSLPNSVSFFNPLWYIELQPDIIFNKSETGAQYFSLLLCYQDIDVMWLRNPFTKLSHAGEDMQISCDSFNGHPLDDSNSINTGFYFVASNLKTITLFDEWYERRKNTTGLTEHDVLSQMRYEGIFRRLDMKVTYLDTLYFSGFCEDSRDFQEVRTVHANCCPMLKAKLTDLNASLEVWKRFRSTSNATWPGMLWWKWI